MQLPVDNVLHTRIPVKFGEVIDGLAVIHTHPFFMIFARSDDH